jgi:hypothetical protein
VVVVAVVVQVLVVLVFRIVDLLSVRCWQTSNYVASWIDHVGSQELVHDWDWEGVPIESKQFSQGRGPMFMRSHLIQSES